MIQNADSQADRGHRDEIVDKTHQHNNNNNNKSEEERRESRPTKKDLQDVQKPRFLLLSGGCGGRRVRGFAIRIRSDDDDDTRKSRRTRTRKEPTNELRSILAPRTSVL
jgi:hypothetical protein